MASVNPYQSHPIRRYSYAWQQLSARVGKHLDFGCNVGDFLGVLQETTALDCYGIDAHQGYLQQLSKRYPNLKVQYMRSGEYRTQFPNQFFDSVSMLDTLEHVSEERESLKEIYRIMKPKGILVITVPRKCLFSFMDSDNAKYRFPRIHKWVYQLRYDKNLYRERFVDLSDGLRGDIAVEKDEHTNYEQEQLVSLLHSCGFDVLNISGANLFWRFFQIPGLLLPNKWLRSLMDKFIYWDGLSFQQANLFITVIKQ